jgi:hypothetical protein
VGDIPDDEIRTGFIDQIFLVGAIDILEAIFPPPSSYI